MDITNLIPKVTHLGSIDNPKGNLLKVMQKSSEDYYGFGEAYFTSIYYGETKVWKKHTRMNMNLVVPIGMVQFDIYDENLHKEYKYVIGEENYSRLTIPKGFWVAFTGVGVSKNLVLNIACIEHDPNESINCALEDFPIKINKSS